MATAGAAASRFASASLYVGDLARDVTEAQLFEIFNAVGPVASVRICRDAATRRSLGYAYVNFHRVEDAERALDTMNYKSIRGVPCRIMPSHRDPSLRKSGLGNIFVKNLAKNIDSKTLYDTFSMFGNILSCKVATNKKTGESLGYGFVHYENEESSTNAVLKADGKVIAGQKITVSKFKPKKDRGGDKSKFTNLFVKNLPVDISEAKFTEMFAKFGEITASALSRDEKESKLRGFGFINFAKAEDAKAALEATNGKEMGDKKLYVAPHQKKEDRERELRQRWEQKKAERQKQYQGVNLYVKNLADTVDDARLLTEFNKFGHISSAKVMFDDHNKSKGFGFVCFLTSEDATKAVTEMNGRMVDGKPLYVALAQRKDVRRAQLEAHYAARMGYGAPPGMYPGPQGGPILYQGMQQRPLMYPQQMMMPGRWNPGSTQGAPGGPMMMPPQYHVMPMPQQPRQPGAGGPPGRGRGRGRGAAGGGRGGGGGGGGGQPQQGPAGPGYDQRGRGDVPGGNVRYTNNVRNPPPSQQAPMAAQQGAPGQPRGGMPPPRAQAAAQKPAAAPAAAPAASATPALPSLQAQPPLTIQQLAAAPESTKKQMIGERLFPLVQVHQPQLAGKITGMLLEMDNGELIHLLESRDALLEKVEEALSVLRQAQEPEEEADEEEEDEEEAGP